jgi:hypothetical protein
MRRMGEPRVKGVILRDYVRFMQAEHGDAALDATLRGVSSDLGTALREGHIFTGNWYPIAWYRDLHAAGRRATGLGLELARAKGAYGILQNLHGIYKIFILVTTPAFLISRAGRLFNNHYELGTLEVVQAIHGRAEAQWSGCAGFDENLWQGVIGGCEAALKVAGAAELRVEILAGGRTGDEDLRIVATWQALANTPPPPPTSAPRR